MKPIRVTMVLVALVLLAGLGAMSVAAEGPVASIVPSGAGYIDNLVHPIQANQSVWHKFDYKLSSSGSPQMTTLKLLYGNRSGVGFEIYEPQDINAYTDTTLSPVIGRGMPEMIPCDTGWCATGNLVLSGAFGATGTYHVRIFNTNEYATTYLLTAEGKGISLAQPIAVTAAVPAATTVSLDDPNKAKALDGKSVVIPANSAVWQTFSYPITDWTSHPAKTLTLLYGNKSGLAFEVYSPEILGAWWDNNPIGEGKPQMAPCETGWCRGDNLVWSGAFGGAGTYFVRIINPTAVDMPAVLTLQ